MCGVAACAWVACALAAGILEAEQLVHLIRDHIEPILVRQLDQVLSSGEAEGGATGVVVDGDAVDEGHLVLP